MATARTKLAWFIGVGLGMGVCYFPPQWWPLREAAIMPGWFGEDAIPFLPWWSVVYQSVFLLHAAALWMGEDMAAIRRYGQSILWSFLAGALIFWVWPTMAPRPSSSHFVHQWLVTFFDGPRNALPSLHAAMSTVGVLHFWRKCGTAGRGGLLVWWLALMSATLFIHQHRVVDLLSGTAMGMAIWWGVGRSMQRAATRHGE